MDKSFEIQKQVRDNVKDLQSYLTDLQNWEKEMKRKEAALNGEFEQDLPPVRSKMAKEKPIVSIKKPEKKISSSDYNAWDKFDADKACEEIDMAEVGPSSLDGKKSQQEKLNKLKEEAIQEKDRGNNFVKLSKWDEAIACYNRAIELVKDDATYYANRSLCHLKKNNPHLAESDCTEAIKLDSTYVKAYHRRALAREKLGSLKSALKDLEEIQKLEPSNEVSMKLLKQIKLKIGTKGQKTKSSTNEPKKLNTPKQLTALEKWKMGIGEDICVIQPVNKPPHLRSKKPLIQVPITELSIVKPTKQVQITEISIAKPTKDKKTQLSIAKPTNEVPITEISIAKPTNEVPNKLDNKPTINNKVTEIIDVNGNRSVNKINGFASPESNKLITDCIEKEKDEPINLKNLVPPTSNYQFTTDWKSLKGHNDAQSYYLSIIDPDKMPSIFENALESDILAELIRVLCENRDKFKLKHPVFYLKGISKVKRFSALSMFLSGDDKKLVNQLLLDAEQIGYPNEEIDYLRKKYEV